MDQDNMSSSTDLGAELWALVYHLYAVYHKPYEAFRELSLRTGTTSVIMDETSIPSTPHALLYTRWYSIMREAYAQTRRRVRDMHTEAIEDARVLVRDLYPRGCNLSDYADAVQTCVAMFTVTVPATISRRYIDAMSDVLSSEGRHYLSVEDLTRGVVDDLLVTSLIPMRWWSSRIRVPMMGTSMSTSIATPVLPAVRETNSTASPTVQLPRATRVCARRQPLELVIEYVLLPPAEKDAIMMHTHNENNDQLHGHSNNHPRTTSLHKRHRVVALDGLLTLNTSVAALARRLAASHEVLVSESALQRVLVQLQQQLLALPSRETSASLTTARLRMQDTIAKEADSRAESSSDVAGESAHSCLCDTTDAAWAIDSVNMNHAEAAAVTTMPTKDDDVVRKADVSLLYRDPEAAMRNVDLNDADDITLNEFKEAMNVTFQTNAVRPGDVGYVYDKRVEATRATQRSEWDDDDDE